MNAPDLNGDEKIKFEKVLTESTQLAIDQVKWY